MSGHSSFMMKNDGPNRDHIGDVNWGCLEKGCN
jgi:hypothetical protein